MQSGYHLYISIRLNKQVIILFQSLHFPYILCKQQHCQHKGQGKYRDRHHILKLIKAALENNCSRLNTASTPIVDAKVHTQKWESFFRQFLYSLPDTGLPSLQPEASRQENNYNIQYIWQNTDCKVEEQENISRGKVGKSKKSIA